MPKKLEFFEKILKNTQRFINKNSNKKLQLFSVSTLIDIVRIQPSLFGSTLKKAAESILKSKYESMAHVLQAGIGIGSCYWMGPISKL